MSYPKKIVKVRPVGGIVSDLPAFEVADEFYSKGTNVHFRNAFAERTQGHAEVYTGILTTLRNISNCVVGGINYWVYHGHDNSSVVTGSTHTDITIAAGLTATTAPNRWTSGLLNGVHFANNGVDAPMYWDGIPANKMLELPNWPANTSCQSMRAFKFHLFAMNITSASGEFTDQVLWSNAAEPGAVPTTWTAAATNEAGDATLAESSGPVIDGLPLRSSMMIYKQHSAYIVDYVGGNNIFNFRKAFVTSGVLSRNCVAEYRGRHFVVTDGDVILTDGSVTESLLDNRRRNTLFNSIDATNIESTFVMALPKHNEIWVCYPSSGNTFCDKAMIWDGVANAWGDRDVPLIAHGAGGIVSDTTSSEFVDDQSQVINDDLSLIDQTNFSTIGDKLVMAKTDDVTPTNSVLYEVDSGVTFDGTKILANIGKESMSFDEPNRVKFVRRIIPHVVAEAGTELLIRVGSQMSSGDSISWRPEVTFTVGTDKCVDTITQGMFLSFEFRSTGTNPWKLTGWDVEAELRGYF